MWNTLFIKSTDSFYEVYLLYIEIDRDALCIVVLILLGTLLTVCYYLYWCLSRLSAFKCFEFVTFFYLWIAQRIGFPGTWLIEGWCGRAREANAKGERERSWIEMNEWNTVFPLHCYWWALRVAGWVAFLARLLAPIPRDIHRSVTYVCVLHLTFGRFHFSAAAGDVSWSLGCGRAAGGGRAGRAAPTSSPWPTDLVTAGPRAGNRSPISLSTNPRSAILLCHQENSI